LFNILSIHEKEVNSVQGIKHGLDLRELKFTTTTLLEEACRTAKDRTFLEFPSRGFKATYGEFQAQVNRIANLLTEQGIKKSDKVAIMSENSPEFIHVSYAVTSMGAIWVPVNSLLLGESLRYIMDVSDSTYVIVSARYREQIEEAIGKVDRPIQLLSLEEVYEAARGKPAEYKSPAEPDDLCYLLYTSGTTGFPKGVLHTHISNIRTGVRTEEAIETTSDDRVYIQLPFFHAWANLAMLGLIYYKAAMVVDERFHADTYWENVDKYKITQGHWTGTMPLNLLKLPESSLDQKAGITVFGTIGSMYDVIKERWPNNRYQSLFGLSEHATFSVVLPDGDPRSDGKPKYPDEVFILDDNEKPLPQGETGEIMIRCKCGVHMQGYYKNPEATAKTLRGDDLYTGDLGYLDENGNLHFAGRKKDALRVRGEMVSIDHTEHLINQHPKIAESAITPYRPPEKEVQKEDEIVAHIVPKKGEILTPEEFHMWSEQNLARFMRPRYIIIRDSLPKTATERIQHFKLKGEGIKEATKLF
jgi:crotonobetaine/carnitine-CoA ligase